jgi:AraC-like DNA-binding protein/TolA-binding protein
MNPLKAFLIFLFLTFSIPLFSKDNRFDVTLKKMEQLQGEELRKSVLLFYDSIRNAGDYQTRIDMADKVFQLTSQKDEIAHIYSLVFIASHKKPYNTALFDKAYQLAKKHNRIDEINDVEHNRALYFMSQHQYDSAMIYILRYQENVPMETKGEGSREISNLLGDIYYNAGIYNKASDVYSALLEQYEKEENWNYFRPYVMMNNLGQISLHLNDTIEAKAWFTRSLTLAEQRLNTNYRNNTIGYIKIRLAETNLKSGDLDEAEQLLSEVAAYPDNEIYEDVKQEWMYCKALLLLKKDKPDEAMKLAKQLIPGDSLLFSKYRFIPEVYPLLSEINVRIGRYTVAYNYSNQYKLIKDSIDAQNNLARSMIILAENNEQITKLELQQSKVKNTYLFRGLLFLLFTLTVITLLYFKLYKSKLELIRKTLENNTQPETIAVETNHTNTSVNDEELIQQKELITKLKQWMESQKPYLDPGLSILEASQQLSTNRTYLSRAINSQLKTSFPSFVNEYRIKESIRLILSGFTQSHTQEALAIESGFASRNVFTNAFKKYTGVVPSFFIANYRRWENQEKGFVGFNLK